MRGDKVNIKQVRDKAIILINFKSVSGNLILETDASYADYALRIKSLIDMAQKEIASSARKIRKQHKISQKPIESQLTLTYPFDIQQHLDTDITTQSCTASKAYSFKVDNLCDVFIEESVDNGLNWYVNQSISHTTPINEFYEYKGIITPSQTYSLIRLRFSGNYVYNIRDIALYKYMFVNASAVPQYTNYNLYTMPSDFYKLNKLTLKGNRVDGNRYTPTADFYWEKSNILAVNYYITGEYAVDYFAYPTTITDDTADTAELEVAIEAQEAIPYYVAAHLMMDENGNINNKLYAMYQGKLANMDDTVMTGTTAISNTFYTSNRNTKLF